MRAILWLRPRLNRVFLRSAVRISTAEPGSTDSRRQPF